MAKVIWETIDVSLIQKIAKKYDTKKQQQGINDQSVDLTHMMIWSTEPNPTTLDGLLQILDEDYHNEE